MISKTKQQDLDAELGRMLRKGSKQPSVRSAREQLEEAKDVTRPDTSKTYENFQQSKPEELTSTPALPVKVVARSIDEIIASLQSTSPSLSEQTIKELLESVLGQNYNIKMESNAIEDVVFEDFLTDHDEELAEQDDHDFYDYGLRSLIKRSVSALEMTAFKDETLLNMSANFKTSMKELKVMKQWIAEQKVETEIGKSSPTKQLLNQICDDLQSMQTDTPVENTSTFTGQENIENDIVLVEQPQKAQIKNTEEHPSAFHYCRRGAIQRKLGKLKSAMGDLENAISLEPLLLDAYWHKHLIYLFQDRISAALDFLNFITKWSKNKAAIRDFTTVIKEDPSNDQVSSVIFAYLNIGLILLLHLNQYYEAIKQFTNAVEIDPLNGRAYVCRAQAYHKVYMSRAAYYGTKGKYSKAILNCNEAIRILPNSEAYFYRGTLKYQNKTFKAAIEDLTKTIDLNKTCILAYYNRAVCYNQIKGFTQAQKDFLRAIHLNPMYIKARLCLGDNLQALGKLQSTWSQFTVAICIDPKRHAAYDGRAVCLQVGETFAAFQDTNATLKLTVTTPWLTNRGIINQLMGYLPCAVKDYQQAISVDPNYALAYFNAANIVLQHDPRNESAVMNRAITNTLANNSEEAKADFEKAICLCPFSAAVYFNTANFCNGLKQYELAEKDISTALSVQPNDALMYKFRADIHGKFGFNKEAVEDYKQAISIQEQIDSM
ncbi:LOW QUALITY PROTEIN: tetratricopeptide repeat protein 6 [Leptosomus discolor]